MVGSIKNKRQYNFEWMKTDLEKKSTTTQNHKRIFFFLLLVRLVHLLTFSEQHAMLCVSFLFPFYYSIVQVYRLNGASGDEETPKMGEEKKGIL